MSITLQGPDLARLRRRLVALHPVTQSCCFWMRCDTAQGRTAILYGLFYPKLVVRRSLHSFLTFVSVSLLSSSQRFSDVLLFLQWRCKRMRCWVQRSTISKGAALHISGSIANQLVLNLPAFLHFTEHTVHNWRGEQLGWVAHGQIEDVAKARPRAELKVFSEQSANLSVFFSDLNFTCYNKLQVTTISF